MRKSRCICKTGQSTFKDYIVYKNETVFRDFEGTVIGKCTNCGILKTFSSKKSSFNPKESKAEYYEEHKEKFTKLFKPIVEKIYSYKRNGKVLDVGCSTGLLLSLLKDKGYKVWGIEPNIDAYKIAHKRIGENVYNGIIKGFIKKNKTKFDIIIYNHVLEHINNLNIEMKLIQSSLKKHALIIIGIPNTDNIIFFIRKKYWESLMPNEHVWHFNTKNCAFFLEKNTFKILDISYKNDSRKDYPFFKKYYFSFFSLLNHLSATGEAMLIVARRA